MTELQLPPPRSMPHAIASGRTLDGFPPRFPRFEQLLPPLSLANPSYTFGNASGTQQQASFSYPRPLTPPDGMSAPHGGLDVTQYNGYGSQRGGEMLSGQRRQEHAGNNAAYSSNNAVNYQVPGHHAGRAHGAPPSPKSQRPSMPSTDSASRRKTATSAVAPALQIPSTIRTPQGSMPQLAAEITCLFWFENSSTLQQALDHRSPHLPVQPLAADAIPSTGFRKWVTTILATTQVAQNVILLALLFIYRLKQINPAVKGKPGSEYRLLTVALMLGNKFLDDNTYTNKTWAEVSGISVQEVHIMEVEFLSNMKYNLFTSKADWEQWHVTLGKFGTFFEKASRASFELTRRPTGPSTPTVYLPPTLPSPPASNHASPPFLSNYSPHPGAHSQTPVILPQVSSAAVSPLGPPPETEPRTSRKRSYDDQAAEHPYKRQATDYTQHYPLIGSGFNPNDPSRRPSGPEPAYRPDVPVTQASTLPRLALPNLLIPSSHSGHVPPMQHPTQPPPQLPPPGARAMSLVYPSSQQWSQAPPVPSSTTPMPPGVDVSRQLSPYPAGSAGSSPVNTSHPPASTSQNQSHLSPSYFLQQRSSPYRPVRGVQTLLVPPPSTSIQNPSRHIGFDQMQYQPLGRPINERRAGPLPYMNHEAWPQTNQFNQWPILPPPHATR